MSESNDSSATVIPVDAEVLKAEAIVDTCHDCGRAFDGKQVRRSPSSPDYCMACAPRHRALSRQKKEDNSRWIQVAEEGGIPLWEQQPNETATEYDMWVCYRDLWPAVRPTVTKVASTMGVSTTDVQKAFRRWTWAARLQAWIREVNADRVAELRQSRRKMVEDHITIGEKLRAKALKAVDNLDEYDVTPSELVQLLKLTQQFEETARDAMDAVEQATAQDIDNMPAGLFESGDKDEKQLGNARGISQDDAAEVVKILAAAGVLNVGSTKIGVRQTTTTEVAVGNEL